jgi:phosphonate transport system substrate-binding protein
MMSRRLAALLAAPLFLASCSDKSNAPAGPHGVVRFSVPAVQPGPTTASLWRPIFADMRVQTGLKVEPHFTQNRAKAVEALRAGTTDAGLFSNQAGLDAVRAGGEVFARAVGLGDADDRTSVLIVRAESPLTLAKVLRCDQTLVLGMEEASSTAGALAPLTYLFEPRGIDPRICFRQVRVADPAANLLALADRRVDVATSDSITAARLEGGAPPGAAVKVIWRSPVLPQDALVWRKDLDPVLKEKLRLFFLTYGQGNGTEAMRQRAALAHVDIAGFRPADDSHLLPTREMEATRTLVQAWRSFDPARIAKAAATLDAIRSERLDLEGRTRTPAAAQ